MAFHLELSFNLFHYMYGVSIGVVIKFVPLYVWCFIWSFNLICPIICMVAARNESAEKNRIQSLTKRHDMRV